MSNLISKIVVPSSTEATGYALYNIKDANAIRSSEKGVASGVATLDSSGKVPSSQLPSYVDDVIEGYYHDNKFYATYTPGEEGLEDVYSDEITAESGKIYVDKNTNQSYRWSGSAYIVISSPYTLPTASANTLGGVKVGDGLSIDNNGILSAEGQEVEIGTTSPINDVKLFVDEDGDPIYDVYTKAQTDDLLDEITDLIPAQATTSNQLADKDFVNSSVSTATATYRGCYNLVSDLSLTILASHGLIETALGTAVSGTPDNNDYAFVQIPTADATPTEIASVERYKFNGTLWSFEYTLNNSGFTAAQWAAVNSNITSGLVTKLNALSTNSQNSVANLFGMDANGNFQNISTSNLASVLGTPVLLPNGTNFNDINETGIYYTYATTTATNCPGQGSEWYIVEVSKVPQYSYLSQIAKQITGTGRGLISGRTFNTGDGWSSWCRIDNYGCDTPSDLASLLGGVTTSLPSNLDLDTLTTYGVYKFYSLGSITHKPDGINNEAGVIEVLPGCDGGWRRQIITTNSGQIFERKFSVNSSDKDNWQRIDNYGTISLSDLATALGTTNNLIPKNVIRIEAGKTAKLTYATNSGASTLIGTSGTLGASISVAVFAGYGMESYRNYGKVLINGGQVKFYVSKSVHAIYISNMAGINIYAGILEFIATSPTITYHTTSDVESDFSSEVL